MNIEEFVAGTADEITSFMEDLKINDMGLGIDLSKGKKLRGTLVVLVSKCINGDKTKALEFASAIELIHGGSIQHDDVIDEHVMRRGTIPLNLLKGSKFAVLAGDRMFTLATKLGAKSGRKEAAEVAEAMESVLSGAMKEISINEFLSDVIKGKAADKFYMKMIGLKTAGLFKSAGRFGAMTCTDKNSVVNTFGDIGYNTGIAYQIADDLVDIIKMSEGAEEVDLGKVISIIPAIFNYNKEYAKKLPFTMLSGRISIDKVIDMVSSLDMSGRMFKDIERLCKETEDLVNDLINMNEYNEILKQYPKYCVNQILAEVGESI